MVILMTKIFITHKILKYDFDRVIKKGCEGMNDILYLVLYLLGVRFITIPLGNLIFRLLFKDYYR